MKLFIGQNIMYDKIEERLKRLKRIASHRKLKQENAQSYFEALKDNNETDQGLLHILSNY